MSTNFNNKKSGIVEIVMIKFGLTILTIEGKFWPNCQKFVVIGPPPPLIYCLEKIFIKFLKSMIPLLLHKVN
jgi:hypothetical protein